MIDQGMITAWLAVACLAPSPHNNQPWLARIVPDGVILRLDPHQLPALGPDRVQFIALGAFVENLGYAAAVDGYRLMVDKLPITPRRTAEITVRFLHGTEPADNAASFLAGARHRRTNRGPYRSSLPPGATGELRAIPCEPATSLTLIEDMAGARRRPISRHALCGFCSAFLSCAATWLRSCSRAPMSRRRPGCRLSH